MTSLLPNDRETGLGLLTTFHWTKSRDVAALFLLHMERYGSARAQMQKKESCLQIKSFFLNQMGLTVAQSILVDSETQEPCVAVNSDTILGIAELCISSIASHLHEDAIRIFQERVNWKLLAKLISMHHAEEKNKDQHLSEPRVYSETPRRFVNFNNDKSLEICIHLQYETSREGREGRDGREEKENKKRDDVLDHDHGCVEPL